MKILGPKASENLLHSNNSSSVIQLITEKPNYVESDCLKLVSLDDNNVM